MASPHVSKLIAEAEAAGKPYYAIEFFPPRTPEGLANLYARCSRFKAQGECGCPPHGMPLRTLPRGAVAARLPGRVCKYVVARGGAGRCRAATGGFVLAPRRHPPTLPGSCLTHRQHRAAACGRRGRRAPFTCALCRQPVGEEKGGGGGRSETCLAWAAAPVPPHVRHPCTRRVCADPLYADVTWGAGGSTSDLTLDMCVRMKEEYGLVPNMHLTWCGHSLDGGGVGEVGAYARVGTAPAVAAAIPAPARSTNMPVEKLTAALEGAKAHGITNIVALRGGESW
jgi:hypothetical protein